MGSLVSSNGERRRWLFCSLVAVSMLLASCGDDDSASGDSEPQENADNTADGTDDNGEPASMEGLERFPALSERTGEPADGEPIDISMINIEEGAVTFTQMSEAAEAAMAYINETGGIDGRPLELSVCQTDLSPETAQTCVTEVANEEPLVVMTGVNFQTEALYEQFEPLGVTVIGNAPGFNIDTTHPTVINYDMRNFGYPVATIRFALDNFDVDQFTVYSSDSPLAYAATQEFGDPLIEDTGAEVSYVLEASSAPDFIPSSAQVVSSNPDAVYLSLSGAGCVGGIDGMRTQGYDGPIIASPVCLADQVRESMNEEPNGVYFSAARPDYRLDVGSLPSELQPEMELYLDRMAAEAPDAILDDLSAAAFASVINMAEALQRLVDDGGELEPEPVGEALRGQGANFLTEQDYDCSGDLIPSMPSFCNSTMYMHQWEDGGPVLLESVDLEDDLTR